MAASKVEEEDEQGLSDQAGTVSASTASNTALSASTGSAAGVTPKKAGTSAEDAAAESSTASDGPSCANCNTRTTSLWRRSAEGQTLCNACSLYQKMKGTPRPVSLKTDTIKHRNRSKGDKKLKEGQPPKGKAKKAAGSRGSSVGPPSVRGNTAGIAATSLTRGDVHMSANGMIEEEDRESLMSYDTDEKLTSTTMMGDDASVRTASTSAADRRRPPDGSTVQLHQPAGQAASLANEDIARSLSRGREMAAAMALATASYPYGMVMPQAPYVFQPGHLEQQQQQHASARRSASVDSRGTFSVPASPIAEEARFPYAPYGYPQAFAQHLAFAERGAAIPPAAASFAHATNALGYQHPGGQAFLPGMLPAARGGGTPAQRNQVHHSAAMQAAAGKSDADDVTMMQGPDAAPALALSAGPASLGASGSSQMQHDLLNAGSLASPASARQGNSATPADTPQRSPLFAQRLHSTTTSGRNSPVGSTDDRQTPPSAATSIASTTHSRHHPPEQMTASSSQPTDFASRSSKGSAYTRSASSDPYRYRHASASASRMMQPVGSPASPRLTPLGTAVADRGLDVERERQKARLDQLFAAAGQRLSENAAPPSSGPAASGRQSVPSYQQSANSYKPYDMSSHPRSSSRIGRHASDSRFPSTLANSSGTGPGASSSIARSSPQQGLRSIGRPGSSASSSGDSVYEVKKGMSSIASPQMQGYASPPLPVLQDLAMAVDDEPRNDDHQQSLSPPFGLHTLAEQPSLMASTTASASASERRGRSTTRRGGGGRGTTPPDMMTHELGALRMRDSSRSSSHARSRSSAFLPHLSDMCPPAGYSGATIDTAELDDGIVRNALTHRPISDLRASDSPSNHTLPSLTEALSSSGSSRSLSGSNPRSGSRHSGRTAMRPASIGEERIMLPPPNGGFDEVARLQTRIQELEFINGLLESRVSDLENGGRAKGHSRSPGRSAQHAYTHVSHATRSSASSAPHSRHPSPLGRRDSVGPQAVPPHGSGCGCRCTDDASDLERDRAADRLKSELAAHGIQGIGEGESKELLALLVSKLGYRAGDLT